MKGIVYLIGAGPGDPNLLTLRGRDLLAKADVIVYDALIDPTLLQWAKPGALRVYVGKRGKRHVKEQSEINNILARKARSGMRVARLKGGDPLLFGRGGEEAAYLAGLKIPFEIVPGVTSASAAAACAGIPLTDRRLSSMVTFVTGHEGDLKQSAPVEWSRISRESTLVIYMGLEKLSAITERLQHHHWDEQLPAAAVEWAGTARQRVVEGTLGTIAWRVRSNNLTSPVLVIVGKVAAMRKTLQWFDRRPLFGKKIVTTRAAEQSAEFSQRLAGMGAEVYSFPAIRLVPPRSWAAADRAIREIARYHWILFTSVNGVTAFFERLKILGFDIRDLKGVKIAAIGPKTKASLLSRGLRVDVCPAEFRAEALAAVLGDVRGKRILLARAEKARDILPDTLREGGAMVTVAVMYRTLKTNRLIAALRDRLLRGQINVVTFTSSSTVDGFMAHFTAKERRRIFARTRAAVIGPITGRTLRSYGVTPTIRAKRYTTEELAGAIAKFFS